MVFSKSSRFKNVQSNWDQRKHDFQTTPVYSGKMIDDPEGLQVLLFRVRILGAVVCWMDAPLCGGSIGPCEHHLNAEPGP